MVSFWATSALSSRASNTGKLRTWVSSHNELDSLVILGFLQGKARRCLPLLFQFPSQLLRLLPDFRGVALFFDCARASPCEHTRIREKEIEWTTKRPSC